MFFSQLRGVVKTTLNSWSRDSKPENTSQLIIKPNQRVLPVVENTCGVKTTVKIFMSSNDKDRVNDAIATSKFLIIYYAT